MLVRSLGYLTDFAFARFDGEVIDRGDYVVTRTPTNPFFSWGHCVLFPRAPTRADLVPGDPNGWLAIADRELGAGAHSRVIGWDVLDGGRGDAADAVPPGHKLDEGVILSARVGDMRPPPHPNAALQVRPIETDADWRLAAEALGAAFLEHQPDGVRERRFIDLQFARYRAMIAAGLGVWLAGFIDGAIAATLGVFVTGDRLGRYQLVGTVPRFQRQGACGTLVHAAAGLARERLGVDRLVIAADAGYRAWRVYESVGLQPIEKLVAFRRIGP